MEKPPAYSEYPSEPAPPTSTLSQHLTEARTVRINRVITDQILPQFQTAVVAGLSKTTLVLLPSADQESQSDPDKISKPSAPEVLGFPSADNVTANRLLGTENTLEFWRQPTVARELENMLKSRLQASGHRIWAPASQAMNSTNIGRSSPTEAKKSGPFSRRKQSESQRDVPTSRTTGSMESSWTSPRTEPLRPGEIRVEAQLKDIPIRVVTDMGLYDTQTGSGVIVKMEIGG